ncbi:EXOG Nuclease, partial [Polyodon spathula]|nr:EXOG Nuclease [Polyodon spathula]
MYTTQGTLTKGQTVAAQGGSYVAGKADQKHCRFKPDPHVPPLFTAVNEDYLGSGWSRGHMAPAGDRKCSGVQIAITETVTSQQQGLLGFLELLNCKKIKIKLVLKVNVSYTILSPEGSIALYRSVIGKGNMAVPTHLYKVILAHRSDTSSEPLALGCFVVPNKPIGFVSLVDLEKMSGLSFFPLLDKTQAVQNICDADPCKLMGFKEFTLYITSRKVSSARTLPKLEKAMCELKGLAIEPDAYLLSLYETKKELAGAGSREDKSG